MRMVSTSDYFAQKETILATRTRAKPPAKGGKAKKALTTSALAQHNAKAMAASVQRIGLCSASVAASAEAERKNRDEADAPSTQARKQKDVQASPKKRGQSANPKGAPSPMKEWALLYPMWGSFLLLPLIWMVSIR